MILHSAYQYVADKEGFGLDSAAAQLIAVHADGGLRDALSILRPMCWYGQRRYYTGRCRGTHWPR